MVPARIFRCGNVARAQKEPRRVEMNVRKGLSLMRLRGCVVEVEYRTRRRKSYLRRF
jgi:hypothetical protein